MPSGPWRTIPRAPVRGALTATTPPVAPGATARATAPAATSPPGALPPPHYYLARVPPGHTVGHAAARLISAAGTSAGRTWQTFKDALAKDQSMLTTLDLTGLSRIEIAGTLTIAALGIALLGAFLILERRREYAVLRSLGASTRQVLVPQAIEGLSTVAAALALGLPIGSGMNTITSRIPTPLFTLSPPLIRVAPAASPVLPVS
jgi:putative ABC transport system permease protein